jgi:subfamily B ATP-binding cassette protein MsbA
LSHAYSHIGTLIIWFVGGHYVLNGSMSVGELIAFQAYLMQMYNPIRQFSSVNVTIQNSLTSVERIFEVFDYVPDVQNRENPLPLKYCRGDITFDHISFTYITEVPVTNERGKRTDPDLVEMRKPTRRFYLIPPKTKPDPPPVTYEQREVLRDIDFHIRSGEVVALVGPSGAGKSTLINFINRFYDPDVGKVLVDGVDIRDYDLNDLRQQIAIVMQDNILFSGTVYENIAYGDPDACERQVIEAAQAANSHGFIMGWDKGYETILGERGVRLSGGQKQRIAIARALLKNPSILILDEATSALDAESEAEVTEALDRLMKGRTTIIIAHRLATVVRANQILVMNEGKIVERGTHTELLLRGGLYHSLYEKQFKAMQPDRSI